MPRAIVFAIILLNGSWCGAQQVNIGAPFPTVNDSFYENIGIRWGYQGNGFFFRGPGMAPMPFAGGGFGANDGGMFGFSNGGLSFNFFAGQGSDRSIISQTPSLTVMNGSGGWIGSNVIQPFVTGWIPVVGGAPTLVSPVHLALARQQQLNEAAAYGNASAGGASNSGNSTSSPGIIAAPSKVAPNSSASSLGASSASDRGTLADSAAGKSLAELKAIAAERKARDTGDGRRLREAGRQAEADGKLGLAINYYRQAERRLLGDEREQVLSDLARCGAAK